MSNDKLYGNEYDGLRHEIDERINARQRTLVFMISAFSAVIAIHYKYDPSGTIILLYPILSCFLALQWLQHDQRIGLIGRYIKKNDEYKKLGLCGWEEYLEDHRDEYFTKILNHFETRNVGTVAFFLFFLTSLFAMIIPLKMGWTKLFTFKNYVDHRTILYFFDLLLYLFLIPRLWKRMFFKKIQK